MFVIRGQTLALSVAGSDPELRTLVRFSARNALVAVLRSQHLQKGNRFGVRLDSLPRSVCHIDDRRAIAADSVGSSTFSDEVEDHLIVATGRCVVQSRVAAADSTAQRGNPFGGRAFATPSRTSIRSIDVSVKVLDEILNRSQTAGRST